MAKPKLLKRKTAGEMSLKAQGDNSIYDPLELAHAMSDDIAAQLRICAETHSKIFDEEEFFLIMVTAGDPLIYGVKRHKYTAFPYLPKPRPQQSVFLFNKITGNCQRLWVLPNAKTMAIISELPHVDKKWEMTKYWCDSFFAGSFFMNIRKQWNITHLTESEYLDAHRAELIQAGCNVVEGLGSDAFDFSKIAVEKIIDKYEAIL